MAMLATESKEYRPGVGLLLRQRFDQRRAWTAGGESARSVAPRLGRNRGRASRPRSMLNLQAQCVVGARASRHRGYAGSPDNPRQRGERYASANPIPATPSVLGRPHSPLARVGWAFIRDSFKVLLQCNITANRGGKAAASIFAISV
jgi:hypothetical protein